MVIGKIGGWTPPFQLTLPQLGILVVVVWLEVQTWSLWLAHLPRLAAVIVAATLPGVVAWTARRTRVEGRSLLRAAIGFVRWMVVPRTGVVSGRAYRHAVERRFATTVVYVEAGPGPEMGLGPEM